MKIKKALISVYDKTNLANLAKCLDSNNVEIISSGGSAKFIQEMNIKVTEISDLTNFPEILDGRVKTLHPRIYAEILAVRDNPKHQSVIADNHYSYIDLVVVNLYPFADTVNKNADHQTCIENIDIGGPTLIRAAAKNYNDVCVITSINDYDEIITAINNDKVNIDLRKKFATAAFLYTSYYDCDIQNWLINNNNNFGQYNKLVINYNLQSVMRYGENPHQKAAVYSNSKDGIVNAKQIQGKQLSFNNFNDADSAFSLVHEFNEPACVIVKHCNPCGVAIDQDINQAYDKAYHADSVSAFGGIVAFNCKVDESLAKTIINNFFELIIATDYSAEALKIFTNKKNLRILKASNIARNELVLKSISGGLLVQTQDYLENASQHYTIETKKQPTKNEIVDLNIAMTICKYVKSNAIVYVKDKTTVALGIGQTSRLHAAQIASEHVNKSIKDFVVASDAFFPFPDAMLVAINSGATAIIQPGGSIKDNDVIKVADQHNVAMIMTHHRHFRH